MKKVFWVTLFLFAASCVACTHTGGVSKPTTYSFTIDIPAGWRKIDRPYLLITKEGPFIQNIMVQNRHIGKSFRYTKKKMRREMLPEEAAQIILDEYASDQTIGNLKVLFNSPIQINGHDGFKILLTYTGPKGNEFHTLFYGFIKADTFFNLRFTAGGQQYYHKDIQTFKHMLKSFQVIKANKS
ncbi:MAG: hypothetical protein PVI82_09985 [Desulfobacterales bacterium]|jgi:hypothetical protein